MKKDRIKDLREDIPNARYDRKLGCFQYTDGSYADLYRIIPKDLVNGDPDDIEMDCFTWAKFYKTYGRDIELVAMKFPCDLSQQKEYWDQILEKNDNPVFAPMIRRKLSELEYRERNTLKKEFFILFFWETEEDIQAGRRGVEETLGVRCAGEAAGVSELLEEIPEKKKRQVFFKFANKNSLIF